MLDIIHAAGWPIWFLLLTSILALALILERFYSLRRKNIIPEKVMGEIVTLYRDNQCPPSLVNKLENGTLFEQLLATAIQHRSLSRGDAVERLEARSRHLTHQLNQNLGALSAVVTLSPLMGLFGTVVGMIEIFGAQNVSGANTIQLAHGISIALYNTGLGLIIAIISMIFYRYFRTRVEMYLVEMEGLMARFLDYAYTPSTTIKVVPTVENMPQKASQ